MENNKKSLEEMYPDRVADIFAEKVLFITGGTGFMGKVLVEKLLRLCPKLAKMYLLVREKKGKSPKDRLHEILKDPLFNMVKKLHGNDIVEKVDWIAGDVTEPNLGICAEQREKIVNEVDFIYHCAATIRFDEHLKKAVILNVKGTKSTLELAKECKKLKLFLHTSTAYCHLNQKVLYEKAYPPPADPLKMIKLCEWLSDENVDSITKPLLDDYPNTYAFTKALGEALVVDEMDNLPVVILRPSIVTPIKDDPIPGWTDNINGPTGLLIGAGKGVIRTMYCDPKIYGDFVPVDKISDGYLLVTFDYLNNGKRRFYNFTSSGEHKVTWIEILDMGREIIWYKYPFNGILWYPGGSLKTSKIIHLICFYLFQWLPAIFIDALLICLGYKPILMNIQRRIYKGYEVFEYYTTRQWDFDTTNAKEGRETLNPLERQKYKTEFQSDKKMYYQYFTDCIHAARVYIMKETDDQLPQAKRMMKVMWCVDILTKTIFFGLILYYLCKKYLQIV